MLWSRPYNTAFLVGWLEVLEQFLSEFHCLLQIPCILCRLLVLIRCQGIWSFVLVLFCIHIRILIMI